MGKKFDPVEVPLGYPTTTMYVDDSGVKAGGSRLLVIAGIKVRRHGSLMRGIWDVRDQTGFRREFKFTEINRGSLPAYYALIDELGKSDAHIIGTVAHRPPGEGTAGWKFYGDVTTRLVRGTVIRNELVTLLMDCVSTPKGVAFEDLAKGRVNKGFGATRIVTAACLDSRSSEGLQMADLVASAIAFDRRRLAGESGSPNSNKAHVVNRLKDMLGVDDFSDVRSGRVNIQTWEPASSTPRLRILPAAPAKAG